VITLILGGARSGKSSVAEARAAQAAGAAGGVTYVATIWPSEPDADLDERVAAHRARRPSEWATVEPPYVLSDVLASIRGVVLLDSLGSWLTAQPDMMVDRDALARALSARAEPTIVVSDEVGWGVHPETAIGRRFRDELGALNRAVADVADEVLVVVAGRLLLTERP
jgi:adenosyl cobinamide kinase/adenosyl cobinamide phosphate guanylyltransferase